MNCTMPGLCVYGISQASMMEWVAISCSRGSSQARDRTPVSCIGRWTLYCCATRETPQKLWKWPQIFEKSVFKDTIKLRISRSWFKAGSKSKDGCPFKRRGEDNGEKIMWRPIWKSRLRLRLFCPMPRNTRGHWNLGEARKCSPQELSEKSSPCCHLDSRLQAYIIHDNLFLLFWATSL